MNPNFANLLYGGQPVTAAAPDLKVMGAGAAVPSPDAGVAPIAASGRAGVGDVFNDPTFWLVATIGAVIALASVSK